MNLLEIRGKFRDLSGRYDLVGVDGGDLGANFFINEASKWLDRTVELQKSFGTYMEIVPLGTWNLDFPYARAIKEVWLTTADGRWQLTKVRYQDLIAGYFTKLPALITKGTPLYYSPTISRYMPTDLTAEELAAISAYTGMVTVAGNSYNAVMLSTPLDKEALVEVKGLFYSPELVEDEDENAWSVNHPLLLIQVAIRQTHFISGNKPMLDVLDRGIDGDLTRLGYDIVEEQIAEIDEMEG
jgi:hypothetical protein